jgi:hypothetical protein
MRGVPKIRARFPISPEVEFDPDGARRYAAAGEELVLCCAPHPQEARPEPSRRGAAGGRRV